MDSHQNFKHITLREAEAKDEVIFAGVASPAIAESEASADEELKPETPIYAVEEASFFAKNHQREETLPHIMAHKVTPPTDAYYETTLEDLKSTKMPLSQKIVIIAAIALIIVAIVYCITTLR